MDLNLSYMKYIKLSVVFVISALIFSCQNPAQQQASNNSTPKPKEPAYTDTRPKDEIYFLNKVKAESDDEVTSDAVKKDTHISAFNKYAADSLKNIVNWEVIVTDINDHTRQASSTAKAFLNIDSNPVYNFIFVAPIKIDKGVDTIAIDNRVDLTYTILKQPKSEALKKQLAMLKNSSKGDTVLISGAITHLDAAMKVNFADFYEDFTTWNVDVLLTDIRKKK